MLYVFLLYLALPCFVANMLPMIFHRLQLWPNLQRPLDGNYVLNGKPLLGSHKTWRGLLAGVGGALVVVLGQWLLSALDWLPLFDWHAIDFVRYGLLAGLGALGGDALGSFIKRRCNLASGRPLLVVDQIDYVLGYLLLTSLLVDWTWHAALFLITFALVANPLTNIAAYFLKIKKTYW